MRLDFRVRFLLTGRFLYRTAVSTAGVSIVFLPVD